jgi:hypothetical protein
VTTEPHKYPPLDWTRPRVISRIVYEATLDELAEREPTLLDRRPELSQLRRGHYGPVIAELIRGAA